MTVNDTADDETHLHSPPPTVPESNAFTIRVDGEELPAHETPVAAYALFDFEGSVDVVIECARGIDDPVVRPLSRGIDPDVTGETLRFSLDRPAKVSVEPDDDRRGPLFLFARRPDTEVPDPADEDVRFFAASEVHHPAVIEPAPGETIYIEGGAVVRGRIDARDADGVGLRGRGVLDGSDLGGCGDSMVRLLRCESARLDGVTVLNGHDPDGWTVVPIECDDLHVRDLNVIGWSDNDDGLDVVGCQDVTIEDYFARTKDDPLVVKATAKASPEGEAAGRRDVRDVRVENATVWNAEWGNALEIGFETVTDEISGVVFTECDVIHAERENWGAGGTFTIHNGDRAHVHDVTYDDVRIEDAPGKLIDQKVLESRYSVDEERGRITDVRFRDIAVVDGPFPPSIMQGYDAEHVIDDVTIENFTDRGDRLTSADDARLILEKAHCEFGSGDDDGR